MVSSRVADPDGLTPARGLRVQIGVEDAAGSGIEGHGCERWFDTAGAAEVGAGCRVLENRNLEVE